MGDRRTCATIVTSPPKERLEELVLIFSNGQWKDVFDSTSSLWIVNRDGSQAALFVENGRAPAWSPAELPPPPEEFWLFLPLILR